MSGPSESGPDKARRRGFTLLELMIAMTLLSVVLVLVYGGFSQISDGALRLRDELTETQELRLLTRMVADDLQSAQWLQRFWKKGVGFHSGISAEQVFVEDKEFSAINFHAAQRARFFREIAPGQDPGLHELGYQVRKAEEGEGAGPVLERREDFYLDNDMENGGLTVVLSRGVTAFLVEFLPADADPNAPQETWLNRWDSSANNDPLRMPKAIRLTIARKSPAGREYRQVVEFNLPGSLKL